MLKKININNSDFQGLRNGEQNMLILQEDLNKNEQVFLINKESKDEMLVEVTSKNIFNNLNDVFKVIPYQLFGNYLNVDDACNKIEVDDGRSIIAYRIKNDNNNSVIIKDEKLKDMIDIKSLKEINMGRSVCRVFEGKLKGENKKVILKVQILPSRNSLKEEYEKIMWMQGKINCPKVFYWNEIGTTKYLLMEFKEGLPSFKYSNIGHRLGEELRKIHSINIENCPFKNNDVEVLLENCLNKIDSIYPEIKNTYPNENKEEIVRFLKKYKPTDKVLIHGDYSMPNILIDSNGVYSFIDMGDISVSTKYFDLYYFMRSLKINKKIDYFDQFKEGYGLTDIDENSLKWMDIIDKSLY